MKTFISKAAFTSKALRPRVSLLARLVVAFLFLRASEGAGLSAPNAFGVNAALRYAFLESSDAL